MDKVDAADSYAIRIIFNGEVISVLSPTNKKDFYEFANFFKDTSYMGTVLPNSNKASTEKFSFIKIVCDKDYNVEHKAGATLGDIVLFCATSPYDFIQGGYKEVTKYYKYPDYWRNMV